MVSDIVISSPKKLEVEAREWVAHKRLGKCCMNDVRSGRGVAAEGNLKKIRSRGRRGRDRQKYRDVTNREDCGGQEQRTTDCTHAPVTQSDASLICGSEGKERSIAGGVEVATEKLLVDADVRHDAREPHGAGVRRADGTPSEYHRTVNGWAMYCRCFVSMRCTTFCTSEPP